MVVNFSFGQQKTRITVSSRNGKTAYCGFSIKEGYHKSYSRQYITEEAGIGHSSGIPDVIQRIKEVSGFDVAIRVFIAEDEDNCFATIAEGRVRVIIADHRFLNRVNNHSGTDWAAISILAHEVGHHIAGFNRNSDQRQDELDADYWSGYILHKLGSAKSSAVKCILTYGTEYDSNSHPNKYRRSRMIKKGWEDALAGRTDYSKCEKCKP